MLLPSCEDKEGSKAAAFLGYSRTPSYVWLPTVYGCRRLLVLQLFHEIAKKSRKRDRSRSSKNGENQRGKVIPVRGPCYLTSYPD
jgi:hypothetical protein